MATDPGEEVKRSIFHKLVKGSDALKALLNAYDMAKRNSYKRSYDFLKSAASTHVQNKLRDNNRDALVKANLPNTNNRGVAMLAAAGSSDETPEQVTISAPAPKAKAKAKAQPCFMYQKGTCDRGDRCPYTYIGEPGSTPELPAEEKKNITEKRRRSRAMPTLPDVAASVTSTNTCTRSPRPSQLESVRTHRRARASTITATPRSSSLPRHHPLRCMIRETIFKRS